MSTGSKLGVPKVVYVGAVLNPGVRKVDAIAEVQARLDADPSNPDAWQLREQIRMLEEMEEPGSGTSDED